MKVISTKGTKKDLIDKFSIIDGEKYFILGIFQNNLVFIPTKKTLNVFMELLKFIRGNPIKCQKKVLKI